MKKAVIKRTESDDRGTFGVLAVDDKAWITGELPWRENKKRISCIPPGKYQVDWKMSPRFNRDMYLVQKVKDRWGIRFHVANFVGDKKRGFRSEVLGCISLGCKKGKIHSQKALLDSGKAIREFEEYLNGESFELTII
jgi:hypothetical protein